MPASSRRSFLNWFVSLPVVASFVSCLGGALTYLWPPKQSRGGGMVELGAEADYEEGMGKVISLESGPIIVLKKGGKIHAYSAVCTHLACPVKWREGTADIFCACHGGIFDTNGKPAGGPVKKPLKPVAVKVLGGRLHLEEG